MPPPSLSFSTVLRKSNSILHSDRYPFSFSKDYFVSQFGDLIARRTRTRPLISNKMPNLSNLRLISLKGYLIRWRQLFIIHGCNRECLVLSRALKIHTNPSCSYIWIKYRSFYTKCCSLTSKTSTDKYQNYGVIPGDQWK